jgi:hypothetical protein
MERYERHMNKPPLALVWEGWDQWNAKRRMLLKEVKKEDKAMLTDAVIQYRLFGALSVAIREMLVQEEIRKVKPHK